MPVGRCLGAARQPGITRCMWLACVAGDWGRTGRWGRKRVTAKWASTVCRLTVMGKQIWVDGSDPIRNENRILDFPLTFSNNAGNEDKFYQ
jgi:hypothetical protein